MALKLCRAAQKRCAAPAVSRFPRCTASPQTQPVPHVATVARAPRGHSPLRASSSHAVRGGPGKREERLRIVHLISACVDINARVQSFENYAGRAAMVGLLVTFLTEVVQPAEGLFGSWDQQCASGFALVATALVGGAAGLATMSTRKLGAGVSEAVFTSLTALSRSAGSVTNKNVDKAVDYVFDTVFNNSMVNQYFIDFDDFI